MAAVVILAGAVRFWNLGENPLWYGDEGMFALAVRDMLDGHLRVMSLTLTNSFQWNLLLVSSIPFMWILGDDVVALRAASVVSSLITLVGMYRLGSELGGRRCGLAAALVFALHPTLVVFTRWGFYTGLSMPFVAWSAWAAFRGLRTGDHRLLWLASAVAGSAVLASFRAAPIALLPPALVLLHDVRRWRTALVSAAVAGLPFAAALTALWVSAGTEMTIAAFRELAGAAAGTGTDGGEIRPPLPLRLARDLAGGFWQLWRVDLLTFAGAAGLALLGRGRAGMAVALLLVGGVVALTGADIAANFYYSLLPAAPLLCVGLGRLADLLTTRAPALLPARCDRRFAARLASAAGAAALAIWFWQDARGAAEGFRTRIDAFCIQDCDDARATADWVNRRLEDGPDGFVIAGGGNSWLFRGEVTNLVYMAAYEGRPTPQVPVPMDRRRFAFDCRLERARFLVTNRLTQLWEVHQGCDHLLRRAEAEKWPLVYRRGENRVFANPATYTGEVLDPDPLIIGLPDFYRRYGFEAMAAGDWVLAAAEFRRLVRTGRGGASAMTNLGVALARGGNPAEAEEWFRRALAEDPGNEPARRSLERVRREQGKPPQPTVPPTPAGPPDPSAVAGLPQAGPAAAPSPPRPRVPPDPRPRIPSPPAPPRPGPGTPAGPASKAAAPTAPSVPRPPDPRPPAGRPVPR